MKNLKTYTVALVALLQVGQSHAMDDKFTNFIHGFDKAQSQLNLQQFTSYLSKDIDLSIVDCENKVHNMRISDMKANYAIILKNADLLSIKRKIVKIENCDTGDSCTIHSVLSERLVGYSGKYDNTTISTDITNIVKESSGLAIKSIKAKIQSCGA